ncbi:hypothetical protein [Fredinandcohnia quinoae]|uniref:DUF4367 domain-containing protein n=1 Tax=Fredinandcohnia quinoae TaxID=2918902 RepID=A0AAW5DXH0_9BACI|nr:hypothetical protein [Fredinandcohnia sp. SECRCQ15]MCH1625351.1 hypothetical protein [Fredinandcohnia sp. SECRCQ15]
MKNGKILIVGFFILMALLVGCSSIEDEAKETNKAVEQTFKAEPNKTNNEYEDIAYYLPKDMKIDKKGDNNLIFKKGDQIFILFVNPNEGKASDAMYQSIQSKDSKFEIDKTFKDKDRFGYVKAYEIDDKLYLLSVGIGGVKMTTETKVSDITENATEMMKVVSSVKY